MSVDIKHESGDPDAERIDEQAQRSAEQASDHETDRSPVSQSDDGKTTQASAASTKVAEAPEANEDDDEQEDGGWRETVKILFHAVVLAMIVRVFFFQPFNIPSGSMEHSLLVGDYLFVSKYSYGYSKYSLPFSPNLFDGRVLKGEPERGDVAVFRLPRDPNTDYIKRVIGLPGDKVQMINGQLHLNGKAIPKEYVGDVTFTTTGGAPIRARRFKETLPSGVSYFVLDLGPRPLDNTGVYTVPEGHYFMLGDNRDNSTDSRVQGGPFGVGYVPSENLIGKAKIIFFSADDRWSFFRVWEWPSLVRWSRIFNSVD